jgi:hypothetical protein
MKKCLFCQHPFTRSQAIQEEINNTTFYRCPNPQERVVGGLVCQQRLPLNFFNGESTNISIVGSTNVGKTYYLLALYLELKYNKSLRRIGISGDLVGDEAVKSQIIDLLDEVKAGKTLDATKLGFASKAAIEISITRNRVNKRIYLSLSDNAGEVFKSLDLMIENLSNVFDADGLIFLIDPVQISNFREDVQRKYGTPEDSVDFSTISRNTIDLLSYIQNNRVENYSSGSSARDIWRSGLSQVKKVIFQKKLPITFAISKFDQIKDQFCNEIPLDAENLEGYILLNEQFNNDFFNDISNEFKDIIGDEEEGDPTVINLLKNSGFSYSFLGCSSGYVDQNNKFQYKPQGVTLPFLWILNQLNRI